jgi:hypothetical protein
VRHGADVGVRSLGVLGRLGRPVATVDLAAGDDTGDRAVDHRRIDHHPYDHDPADDRSGDRRWPHHGSQRRRRCDPRPGAIAPRRSSAHR